MLIILKFLLILGFVNGFLPLITLGLNLLSLIIVAINITLIILIWLGLNDVVNTPEDPTNSKRIRLTRWFLLFYYSIFTLEFGVLAAFLARFFTDRVLMDSMDSGNMFARMVLESGVYGKTLLLLFPLLVSLPFLFRVARTLKFKKPFKNALVIIFLWEVLIELIGFFNK